MMSKTIVHVQADGSVRLEGLANGRPIPKLPQNSFLVDSKDVPDKADVLIWDSDTGKLKVDAAKKTARNARDRRAPLEKLVDEMISLGLIPANKKNEILR